MENLERNINQVGSDFRAIKEKIEVLGVSMSDVQRTADYAQKIGQVYDTGYDDGNTAGYNQGFDEGREWGFEEGRDFGYDEGYGVGYDEGYRYGFDQGFEAGKQAEYDAFWDAYQENGNRTDYSYAFAGYGWTTEFFKPKYDIVASSAYMIFQYAQLEIDLEGYLQSKGLKLDLSKSINTQYLFQRSLFTRIGVVDVSSSTNSCPLDSAFNTCNNLVTIDKIVLKTGSNGEVATSTFMYCSSLENVIFEGVITNSNLKLQWSTKLSKASINSVVNALSTTSSGQTATLSETAVKKAFETSDGANDGSTSAEWKALVATKSNWTIALA